jgi:hypothetical protein
MLWCTSRYPYDKGLRAHSFGFSRVFLWKVADSPMNCGFHGCEHAMNLGYGVPGAVASRKDEGKGGADVGKEVGILKVAGVCVGRKAHLSY